MMSSRGRGRCPWTVATVAAHAATAICAGFASALGRQIQAVPQRFQGGDCVGVQALARASGNDVNPAQRTVHLGLDSAPFLRVVVGGAAAAAVSGLPLLFDDGTPRPYAAQASSPLPSSLPSSLSLLVLLL